ncbi:MAG TPA: hypothetical protein VL133_04900 [Devosia sp.]|nr:hypothetical protein [Devosia sp.]
MIDQWMFVLTLLDQTATVLGRALSGGDGLATLSAVALPLLLALTTRSRAHVLAALVLVVLAVMLARQQASTLALLIYGLGFSVASLGFPVRRTELQILMMQRNIQQVHREMATFLAGLDSRSKALDMPRPATPQRPEAGPRAEAAPQQQAAASPRP